MFYPLSLMPPWLQTVSKLNPLTYEVDALRCLMLGRGESTPGLGHDFAVLIIVAAVLVAIPARTYPWMTE